MHLFSVRFSFRQVNSPLHFGFCKHRGNSMLKRIKIDGVSTLSSLSHIYAIMGPLLERNSCVYSLACSLQQKSNCGADERSWSVLIERESGAVNEVSDGRGVFLHFFFIIFGKICCLVAFAYCLFLRVSCSSTLSLTRIHIDAAFQRFARTYEHLLEFNLVCDVHK